MRVCFPLVTLLLACGIARAGVSVVYPPSTTVTSASTPGGDPSTVLAPIGTVSTNQDNLFLGWNAGLMASSLGTRNVFIGDRAGIKASGITNSVFIGVAAWGTPITNATETTFSTFIGGAGGSNPPTYISSLWGTTAVGEQAARGGDLYRSFALGPGAGFRAKGDYLEFIGENTGFMAGRWQSDPETRLRNVMTIGFYAGSYAYDCDNWTFIDHLLSNPGQGYDPRAQSFISLDGNTGNMYLGKPGGSTTMRGTIYFDDGYTLWQAVPTSVTIDGNTMTVMVLQPSGM